VYRFTVWTVLAVAAAVVSSCDRELCLMTLIFKLDLDRVKMSNCVKYLDQRSFDSACRQDTQTHTHTHPTKCSARTTKVVRNYVQQNCTHHWAN